MFCGILSRRPSILRVMVRGSPRDARGSLPFPIGSTHPPSPPRTFCEPLRTVLLRHESCTVEVIIFIG